MRIVDRARLDRDWFAFLGRTLADGGNKNIDALKVAFDSLSGTKPVFLPNADLADEPEHSIGKAVFALEASELLTGPTRSMFVAAMDFTLGQRAVSLTPRGLRLLNAPRWRQLLHFLKPHLKEVAGAAYDKVKGPIAVASLTAGALRFATGWSDLKLAIAAIIGLVLAAVLENS